MKIAMIGHKRVPSREGGVEIVVKELTARMAEAGHTVDAYNRWDLFTPNGKIGWENMPRIRTLQIPTLHSSALNAVIYSVLASFRALFSSYDVYHYHAIGSCAMLWMPRLLGRPVVATIHGLDWQRAKWSRFASMYLKLGERIAARFADEIIVLSKSNQQYFLDRYHRKMHLIPNGMARMQPPDPDIITAKYGLGAKDYVLYLARIVPEKGLHYLLEAFRGIDTQKRLVVAGRLDWENEYCRQIAEQAQQDPRVILTDFVQGVELEELFGNCTVYVLPSDIEGMPLSLLEAIGYGARCLISDIDENVDAAKGNAVTFRHGDVDSLRDALTQLIQNPDMSTSEPGSTWASWTEVTQQTLSLYRSVIDRKSHKKFVPLEEEQS